MKYQHLCYLLLFALLGLGYMFPVWVSGGIPAAFSDGYMFLWNFWWGEQSILQGKALYTDAPIFLPYGTDLSVHTLVEGVVVPLTWVVSGVSLQERYLIAVSLLFFLNGVSSYALFLRITQGRTAISFLLAVGIAFHPFVIAHLHGGHLNFLALFPLLILLERSVKLATATPTPLRDGAFLGVSFGVLAYFNLYYLFFAVLFLIGAMGYALLRGRRQELQALLVGVGIGVLVGAPKVFHTWRALSSGGYTPHHDPALHSLDLLSVVLPGAYQWLGGFVPHVPLAVNAAESGGYLGYVFLFMGGVALCSVYRRSRLLALLVVGGGLGGLMLAFGPFLSIAATPRVPIFLYQLFASLPQFPSVPARFVLFPVIALFSVIALWARDRPRALPLICIGLIELAPLFPESLALQSSCSPLDQLRSRSVERVLDLSTPPERIMYHQTIHARPLVNGMVARRPRRSERAVRRDPLVRYLRAGRGAAPLLNNSSLGIDGIIVPRERRDILDRGRGLSFFSEIGCDLTTCVFVSAPPQGRISS